MAVIDKSGLEELSGTVDSIIYHNPENSYTVFDLEEADHTLATAFGTIPVLGVGESVTLMGRWENNATYGRQFRIEYYEKTLPAGSAAILKYLSSRAIPGIGPKTAARIVEAFGDDTFDVMENHPELLADIQGISRSKAADIGESFREQFGMRQVMIFCSEYFGPETSVKIWRRFGSGAVDLIKENPYILCDSLSGIGFKRADDVAESLGFAHDSPFRIMAGIKHLLAVNAQENGHVFLPEKSIIQVAADTLDVGGDEVESALGTLIERGGVECYRLKRENCIFLPNYLKAEKYIALKLDLLDKTFPALDTSEVETMIRDAEIESGVEYAPLQKKAIHSMLSSGVTVLTGGPGTGKTTVIRAAIRIFERIGMTIALAAPTGRAAKRMSEATGCEAKTIHRMLEMEYSDEEHSHFRRCEDDTLDEDVFFIDETSMVDSLLMEALLRAIKPGSRIILIGDADQLPSVGAGNVLSDLIKSERFSVVELREIFRQAKESRIVTNAHAINEGEMPDLDDKSEDGDFFFLSREDDQKSAAAVASLISERLPKAYGEKIKNEIQIISPTRIGEAGTVALNAKLQDILNPADKKKVQRRHRDRILREGDRVMQIKNNYDIEWFRGDDEGKGVFNGDIGTITAIDLAREELQVSFDERLAIYTFDMLDELEHAWAITIHKSQGSEYPVVIIPTATAARRLLTRELFYTAVTRAQKMVVVVGQRDTVRAMVGTSRRPKRYTLLRALLSGAENGRADE